MPNWLLDVPMYFVYRDGKYHDVAGASFRDFMAGKLAGCCRASGRRSGILPIMRTTAFPDVRLKKYIETRGADSGRPEMMLAQSALWTGLFYDAAALAAAAALVRPLGHADMLALRDAVPRTGVNTKFGTGTLRDLAREVLAIAADGLGTGRARMRKARMSGFIWRRCRKLPRAGRARQSIGWPVTKGHGAAMLRGFLPRLRFRRIALPCNRRRDDLVNA